MQSDFHYCGTYSLGRMAGLSIEDARQIAVAAQLVDALDLTSVTPAHPEGARFSFRATAHKTSSGSLSELLDPIDQIHVWVPFHFLPGGIGGELSEKLVCVPADDAKNAIAPAVRSFALENKGRDFGLEMLGIAAHVLADTFTHQGFSGVSSRRNRVVAESIQLKSHTHFQELLSAFFDKHGAQGGLLENFRPYVVAASQMAEASTGALGHGAVATCPDLPYLEWSFTYEVDLAGRPSRNVVRSNPREFDRACQYLVGFLRQCAGSAAGAQVSPAAAKALADIFAVVGDATQRTQAWCQAMERGALTGKPDPIPPYDGAAWKADVDRLPKIAPLGKARENPTFRFAQAAALYREFVVRELLPSSGVVVT